MRIGRLQSKKTHHRVNSPLECIQTGMNMFPKIYQMPTNTHQDPTHKFQFLKFRRSAKVSHQVSIIIIILSFHLIVFSAAQSEINLHGEEPSNEQICCTFLHFYLHFVFFYTNDCLAKKLTYKPYNGINNLEDENLAPNDAPSISPHCLTRLQDGTASAKVITPLRKSSSLCFPPSASKTIHPTSFVQLAQKPLSNTTDRVRQEDHAGDRYKCSGYVEHI